MYGWALSTSQETTLRILVDQGSCGSSTLEYTETGFINVDDGRMSKNQGTDPNSLPRNSSGLKDINFPTGYQALEEPRILVHPVARARRQKRLTMH